MIIACGLIKSDKNRVHVVSKQHFKNSFTVELELAFNDFDRPG